MRNVNKILNQFEVNVIMKGIQEEAANDIRLHSAMKNETASTYEAYCRGEECAYEALLYLCGFWSNYFIYNRDVAFAIHEGYETAHKKKLDAEIAEIEKRMYADIDAEIAKSMEEVKQMMDEAAIEKAEIDEMMANR